MAAKTMGKLHLGLMQFDFSHSIAAHDSLSARIALTLGRRSFPHYATFSSVLWDKHRTSTEQSKVAVSIRISTVDVGLGC